MADQQIFRYWIDVRDVVSGSTRIRPIGVVQRIPLVGPQSAKADLSLQLTDDCETIEASTLDELAARLRVRYPDGKYELQFGSERDFAAEKRRADAVERLIEVLAEAVVAELSGPGSRQAVVETPAERRRSGPARPKQGQGSKLVRHDREAVSTVSPPPMPARKRKSSAPITWPKLKAVALSLKLPHVVETTSWGQPTLKAHGKLWCWWSPYADAPVFKVPFEQREMLLEFHPDVFFVHPHYQRHPLVLMRPERFDRAWAKENLVRTWREMAPKRVLKAYDEGRRAGG